MLTNLIYIKTLVLINIQTMNLYEECDICYNNMESIYLYDMKCCLHKNICSSCKIKYKDVKCPFCRKTKNMKYGIVIINNINISTNYINTYEKLLFKNSNFTILKIWNKT